MLDQLIINSKFAKGIVERVVRKTIKQKTGWETVIKFDQIEVVSVDDGYVNIKLSIDGLVRKEDILALLKNKGF